MALYPLNIFSKDPTSRKIRPFIIFIIKEIKWNITKELSAASLEPVMIPKGGFSLPFPNGGLIDSVSHSYSEEAGLFGAMAQGAMDGVPMAKQGMNRLGLVVDPRMTQIYQGTASRQWSGTWQIIPQSLGEAAAVAIILYEIKKFGSPSRKFGDQKVGLLQQPCVFSMTFSNPVIELAMQFDKMALQSYSINYFAQGYASTYKDMMPKHIELTMNFVEFGIKTQEDW